MRRTTKLFLAFISLTAGCSNSLASPGGGGPVIGVWQAVALNGAPFPVLLPTVEGCAMTGLDGSLEVRADGRFTASYRYEAKCRWFEGIRERAIGGRFTATGSGVVFAADSGFSRFETAPLVGGSITGPILTVESTPAPGMTVNLTLQRR